MARTTGFVLAVLVCLVAQDALTASTTTKRSASSKRTTTKVHSTTPRHDKPAPGDTMPATDYGAVNAALQDVVTIGESQESRRCAIGVANTGSSYLINPKWETYNGKKYSNTPAVIGPRMSGFLLFIKTEYSIYGTTGILSYDISGTDYKLAAMWDIPYNTLMYNNVFNIKIYHKNLTTDKNMYEQMKKYSGEGKADQWIERTEYGIKIRGTLSKGDLAQLYVSVDDRWADSSLHAECGYHALWIGMYCWQECNPSGYCWVNKKCSKDSDCRGQGILRCHDPCTKKK